MGWSEGLGGGILITVLLILTFLPPTDPSRRATTRRGNPGLAAPSPRGDPYIDLARSPNISVSLGRTAVLRCRIVNTVKKTVSWLRHKDVNLLSVGRYLYTKDPRMKIMMDRGRGEWMLNIKDIRHTDAGAYECQVNTNPLLKHTVGLTVVEPYTEIVGDSPGATLYIDIRSVLNLTCIVHSPEVPAAIFWKHDGKLLQEEDEVIQTVAGQTGRPTKSFLSLPLTDTEQSGQYQCSPSNTQPVQVEVHIVQDKELPVGQSEPVLQVSRVSLAAPLAPASLALLLLTLVLPLSNPRL